MKSYLEINKIDDHSWEISEGQGNGRTHCYLLDGEKQAVLIDTGLGLLNMKKITNFLTKKEVTVINTHGHLDHISKNYQFEKVYLHPNDEKLFKIHSNEKMRYDYHISRYLRKGYPKWWILSFPFKQYIKPLWYMQVKENRQALYDQMEIDLGDRILKIYETPGHTKGSVCILDESRRWLFTGDTICEKGVLLQLEESTTVERFRESIEKIKEIESLYDVLYTGHQQIPLDKSYVDDYLECTDQILDKYKNNDNEVNIYHYQKATITFNKVNKE